MLAFRAIRLRRLSTVCQPFPMPTTVGIVQFDPDRFGGERQEHKQPFAYLGFGAGMHQCMGQQFAYVQARARRTSLPLA